MKYLCNLCFRIHTSFACTAVVNIVNGVLIPPVIAENDCANRPAAKTWYHLSLLVTDNEARLYIDGVLALAYRPRYPKYGKIQGIVWNGHNNVAFIKNLKVTSVV